MRAQLKKADSFFEQIIQIGPLKKIPISFYKFFIGGVMAFIVDNTVLNIIIYLAFDGKDERLFDTISIAKFISSICGIIVGFIANRYWSFRHKKDNSAARHQVAKYIVVFFMNLLLGSIIFPIYKDTLLHIEMLGHLTPTIANMATAGTIMFVSYFAYRFFVFK